MCVWVSFRERWRECEGCVGACLCERKRGEGDGEFVCVRERGNMKRNKLVSSAIVADLPDSS